MKKDIQGASAEPTGLSSLRDQAADGVSPVPASIPSANGQPDWFEVARALAVAIMFNRATRREHVVGRDGRVRMGMVDMLACYAVDDAAREFFELAGLPFAEVDAPNEHQAMFMAVTGRKWHHWFTERDAIVQRAGLGPGPGKVDLDHIAHASAIEARSGETDTGSIGEADESAAAKPDAQGDQP